MSGSDPVRSPRAGSIIAETVGDETLIIDTESGSFYSLRGVGSALWVLLERGATADDLVSAIADRYPDAGGIRRAVAAFLADLEDDGVLARRASGAGEDEAAPANDIAWPTHFAVPTVDKHDDVGDLLLVDPLHDVDDTGWPNRKS